MAQTKCKLILLCIMAVSVQAFAQGRGAVNITNPGAARAPGQGRIGSFQNNSYGIGSLGPSVRPGAGGDALRANMSGGGMPARGAAAAQAGISPKSGLSGMIASPAAYKGTSGGPVIAAGDIGRSRTLANDSLATISKSYLSAISTISDEDLKNRTEAIVSLVPAEPSLYRNYMERGETLFRSGSFLPALDEFKTACDLADRDWPSMLSLMQTHFTLSYDSFASCSYYLRRVLRVYPELPLLNLQPRNFYGNTSKYADCLVRLETSIAQAARPSSEALLMLAYFRWFDQDTEEATSALGKAYAVAIQQKDTEMEDDIQTLWRGMVGSGKVSGDLTPVYAATQAAMPSDSTAALPLDDEPKWPASAYRPRFAASMPAQSRPEQ